MSQEHLRIDQAHDAIERQDGESLDFLISEVSARGSARLIEASTPDHHIVI